MDNKERVKKQIKNLSSGQIIYNREINDDELWEETLRKEIKVIIVKKTDITDTIVEIRKFTTETNILLKEFKGYLETVKQEILNYLGLK